MNQTIRMSNKKVKREYQKFDPDLYEKAKERLSVARQMIRLGDYRQATDYVQAFPAKVYDYCTEMCDNKFDSDPRPLKLLARFVIRELEYYKNPYNENGQRWSTDRAYYLNQMQKYGW